MVDESFGDNSVERSANAGILHQRLGLGRPRRSHFNGGASVIQVRFRLFTVRPRRLQLRFSSTNTSISRTYHGNDGIKL